MSTGLSEAQLRYMQQQGITPAAGDPIIEALATLRIRAECDSALDKILERYRTSQELKPLDSLSVSADDIYADSDKRFKQLLIVLQDGIMHSEVVGDYLLGQRQDIAADVEQQRDDIAKVEAKVIKHLQAAGYDEESGNPSLGNDAPPTARLAKRQFAFMVKMSPLMRQQESAIKSAQATLRHLDDQLRVIGQARKSLERILEERVALERS